MLFVSQVTKAATMNTIVVVVFSLQATTAHQGSLSGRCDSLILLEVKCCGEVYHAIEEPGHATSL